MKNLLLFALTLFIATTHVFAQDNEHTLTQSQEAKCTELTRAMVNELRLNELGYIKLKALNRERMALAEAAKQNLKDDAELQLKLQAIETDFENKLVAILDASQLQAYAAYKRKSEVNYIAASDEK